MIRYNAYRSPRLPASHAAIVAAPHPQSKPKRPWKRGASQVEQLWTPQEDAALRQHRRNGLTFAACAREIGRSKASCASRFARICGG